jgi:hypothetical protein
MTWFRKFPGIRWHAVDEEPLPAIVSDILKTCV